jgi:RimJ/RimL family protein N-acetyltransferase
MTAFVSLREAIQEDLPIFFEHQLDSDATKMADFPSRDWETFMTHWAKIMQDDTVFIKTILFDGQVAGNIVSFAQDGRREVGFWLGKEFWGRGVATRALSEFLAQEKERPLFAHVARHNLASLRVLEKCGFTMLHVGNEQFEEHILVLAGQQSELPV